jgi:hypothetical protein
VIDAERETIPDELIGAQVNIEWVMSRDGWHRYEISRVVGGWVRLIGRDEVNGDALVPFTGGPFWSRIRDIDTIEEVEE